MRLAIKLLSSDSTVNRISYKNFLEIVRGETPDVIVQLVDADQNGLRYIPAAGATVKFQVERIDQIFPAPQNQREVKNFSIDRAGSQAFAGDSSVWKITLTQDESDNLVSTALRIEVTEGDTKKIAVLPFALKVSE